MPCRATQDGWVMVGSSDKTWSTGEGNGKPLQYSCLENLRVVTASVRGPQAVGENKLRVADFFPFSVDHT